MTLTIQGIGRLNDRVLNVTFSRLDRGFKAAEVEAINAVMGGVWGSLYRKGLKRPSNTNRGMPASSNRSIGLLKAYRNAVLPLSQTQSSRSRASTRLLGGGTSFGAGNALGNRGIGIGYKPYLRRNASHWRAIELGSDHVTTGGVFLAGFGKRRRSGRLNPFPPNAPDPAEFRNDPDALAMKRSQALRWIGAGQPAAQVRNVIQEKNYLWDLKTRLINQYYIKISSVFNANGIV